MTRNNRKVLVLLAVAGMLSNSIAPTISAMAETAMTGIQETSDNGTTTESIILPTTDATDEEPTEVPDWSRMQILRGQLRDLATRMARDGAFVKNFYGYSRPNPEWHEEQKTQSGNPCISESEKPTAADIAIVMNSGKRFDAGRMALEAGDLTTAREMMRRLRVDREWEAVGQLAAGLDEEQTVDQAVVLLAQSRMYTRILNIAAMAAKMGKTQIARRLLDQYGKHGEQYLYEGIIFNLACGGDLEPLRDSYQAWLSSSEEDEDQGYDNRTWHLAMLLAYKATEERDLAILRDQVLPRLSAFTVSCGEGCNVSVHENLLYEQFPEATRGMIRDRFWKSFAALLSTGRDGIEDVRAEDASYIDYAASLMPLVREHREEATAKLLPVLGPALRDGTLIRADGLNAWNPPSSELRMIAVLTALYLGAKEVSPLALEGIEGVDLYYVLAAAGNPEGAVHAFFAPPAEPPSYLMSMLTETRMQVEMLHGVYAHYADFCFDEGCGESKDPVDPLYVELGGLLREVQYEEQREQMKEREKREAERAEQTRRAEEQRRRDEEERQAAQKERERLEAEAAERERNQRRGGCSSR